MKHNTNRIELRNGSDMSCQTQGSVNMDKLYTVLKLFSYGIRWGRYKLSQCCMVLRHPYKTLNTPFRAHDKSCEMYKMRQKRNIKMSLPKILLFF